MKKISVISSTHWDREWYRDFQSFRFHLVNVISEVLDVLEKDSTYTAFILDGQTAIIEDYLEAMPHDREKIRQLLDDKRLIAGPFYTMPDENLASGETLIKNLQYGKTYLKDLANAPTWKVGYVCDMFGHIAQFPQILNGFGIKNAVLGRGTNSHETEAFFNWKSPDGSKVTTFKLPEEGGYATFWHEVLNPYTGYGDVLNESTLNLAVQHVENEKLRTNLPFVILTCGSDHEKIQHCIPKMMKALGEHFECETSICGIEELFEEIREYEIPTVKGELQKTAKKKTIHHVLIPSSLSSRIDIKKANDKSQSLLEKNVGATSALAKMYKISMPEALIEKAYKYLILNNTHDSICGCSLATVHKDMLYRNRQIDSIAKGYSGRVFAKLVDGDALPTRPEMTLSIFNPLPYETKSLQKITLNFPLNYPYTQNEQIPDESVNSFRIFGTNGEIPYHIVDIVKNQTCYRNDIIYPEPGDAYTILAVIDLPAMGMAELYVKPSETPVRYLETMRTGAIQIENEALTLSVTPCGTVTLLDKKHGKCYENLINFTHESETGDGWYHRKAIGSGETHACFESASVIYDGPTISGIHLEHSLSVPKEMIYGRRKVNVSPVKEKILIETELILTKYTDSLDVAVTLHNTAKDSQINFSIPCESKEYFAETSFAFVKRKSGIDTATHDWHEVEKIGKNFAGVIYSENELALITGGGLHECSVNPHTKRMEVTLMRSFAKVHGTTGEEDGQLLGTHHYKMRITPAKGKSNGQLVREKEILQTSLIYDTFAAVNQNSCMNPMGITVKSENIVASIVKSSGKNIIVRLVNYSDKTECALVESVCDLESALHVNLDDSFIENLSVLNNSVSVNLNPHEIYTIAIKHI